MDDEETDFAQMFSQPRDYLLRLETLFVNEQCLQVCGFTKFMLQTLEQPMQWVVSSRSKTFGGSGWGKDQITQRCLARMKAYTKVANQVGQAEFPTCHISYAFFQVFGETRFLVHCVQKKIWPDWHTFSVCRLKVYRASISNAYHLSGHCS